MLPASEARTPRLVTSVRSGAVTWTTSAPARRETASLATSVTSASPSAPGLRTGSARPRGPAAPYWIGLDRDTYHARLADLRRWADTVLRQHFGGYELRDCWPRHVHAVWELSTLAAEWHHAYGGTRPDLARALDFHDRWLPGTMRRITSITRQCMPQCVTLRGPGDWSARPGYRY
jgi:hypothetical protein